MTFEDALEKAKEIQKEHPEYILCGSLALMISGYIPKRDVGDIDFIAQKPLTSKDFPKAMAETKDVVYVKINAGYLCYEVPFTMTKESEFHTECIASHYNVFVYDEGVKGINHFTNMYGFLQEDSEQILAWKRLYGREKDLADLHSLNMDNKDGVPF